MPNDETRRVPFLTGEGKLPVEYLPFDPSQVSADATRAETSANTATTVKAELEAIFAGGTEAINDAAVKTFVEQGETRGAVTALAANPTYAFPRTVLFGTSLEAQNGSLTGIFTGGDLGAIKSARGWAVWADYFLGGRLGFIRNSGVGGNTYAQMRARFQADLLDHDPQITLMGWPANDFPTGRTGAQTIADADYMIGELWKRQIRTVLLTGAGHAGINTATMRGHFDTWRTWALQQNGRRGVIVVDTWPMMADPSTYAPRPETVVDAVHYSARGAQVVGLAAAREITAAMGSMSSTNMNVNEGQNLIGNPTFSGGTGWTQLASTASYPGDGRALINFSGRTTVGGPGVEYEENISSGRFAPGDIVQASATIRWAGIQTLPAGTPSDPRPHLRLRARDADQTFGPEGLPFFMASNERRDTTTFPRMGEVVIKTVPVQIGASVDRLYVLAGFWAAAGGFVEVRDLHVYKLN